MLPDSLVVQSILGASAAASTTFPNLTSIFGPYLSQSAEIILPTDKEFPDRLTPRWTDYNKPTYIGAIKPATENDIQITVEIAADQGLPFFTTGGGHGISNYSTFTGLSIDLSNFRTVELDTKENLLTIGGSTKVSQLLDLLWENGKELPLGSCECVGVVGATLGGGISSLQGIHGLLLDALQSVRVVTPSGALLTASRTENADLFWALRGAGSNFGIVTSATYRVSDVVNNGLAMNADFVFPASANRSFFEIMRGFDEDFPKELGITGVAFFNRSSNEPVIAVNAIYYGPQSTGEPLMQPFVDLNPTMSNISTVTSRQLMDAAFFSFFGGNNGACIPNQHINIYTVGLKQTPVPTFESFFNDLDGFWREYPDYQGRLLLQRYANDAVTDVPDEDAAYAQRQVKTFMNIEGFYTDPGIDAAVDSFVGPARDEFARVSGFEEYTVYSNYARGDEGAGAWYGSRKLPELTRLKSKWDPKGLFSVHNPVPVHGGEHGRVDL
ncbi:FAD-binding oxidoreductase [Aspergillus lucknowensis]|uniref:FAD-binding PCMH-type domain-containing protein n=1 Tax=Aspergillus lucknowensis TaxID=176173 RepID=A0ABR4M3S3_9EURO